MYALFNVTHGFSAECVNFNSLFVNNLQSYILIFCIYIDTVPLGYTPY